MFSYGLVLAGALPAGAASEPALGTGEAVEAFVLALTRRRHFEREVEVPRV